MATKTLALADALGNLIRFRLMPGQRHDSVGVPPLIDGVAFRGLIAGKVLDSNALVTDRAARIVISQHPGRARRPAIDPDSYAWRHLIENFLCKLMSSNASPCMLARPTGASKSKFISPLPSSTQDESPRAPGFGFIDLFLGPVVLALFYDLLMTWLLHDPGNENEPDGKKPTDQP